MKQLLNTLFVTSEDVYLSLDGENVVANRDKQAVARYPLHTLQCIVSFSYAGASPALMGACAEKGIGLAFCTPRGRFLARVCGENTGNVLLRRKQYRLADDPEESCTIARNMIFGKLHNARWSIERTRRDHAMRVDAEALAHASQELHRLLPQVAEARESDVLRGLEGVGAAAYFGVFDEMILNRKEAFFFRGRNRRPALDRVNALLSFAYSLLSHDCASALEAVGLDAYVGFLHTDRPGRASLALDLMEELRPCMADRFVPLAASACAGSQRNASTMASGCRIPCSSACWMRRSAACSRPRSAPSWTRKRTACGSTTSASSTKRRLNTSAARPDIGPKNP